MFDAKHYSGSADPVWRAGQTVILETGEYSDQHVHSVWRATRNCSVAELREVAAHVRAARGAEADLSSFVARLSVLGWIEDVDAMIIQDVDLFCPD